MEALLWRLKSWFEEYVRGFDSDDPGVQKNMDLKAEHTRRVCHNILDIGESLDLCSRELLVAEAAALFHDLGRFEQYRKYRTFADGKSENHAALGTRILKESRILDDLGHDRADVILRAVACHNRLAVPDEGSDFFIMIAKMLRDADKLDIWRVVTDYYGDSEGGRNQAVELDLPDTDEISGPVYEALMAGRSALMTDLRVLNDFKLLQIGWVYDVNFSRTFQRIHENGFLEAIREVLPQNDIQVENVYSGARTYLDARLDAGVSGRR